MLNVGQVLLRDKIIIGNHVSANGQTPCTIWKSDLQKPPLPGGHFFLYVLRPGGSGILEMSLSTNAPKGFVTE